MRAIPRPGSPFLRHELSLDPDDWHAVVEAEWDDALVVVERGDVELWCRGGVHRLFREGAVLFFAGLGLRALHNPGDVPTLVVGIRRC